MALGCNSLHRGIQRNLFTPFLQLWSLVSSLNPSGCLFVCVSCMLGLTQKHKCHKATLLCNKSLIICASVFFFFFFSPCHVLAVVDVFPCSALLALNCGNKHGPPLHPTAHMNKGRKKQSGIKVTRTKTTVLLLFKKYVLIQ